MVKGISRQVIVVHSPDPDLFEQAIFILKQDAVLKGGVTDAALMQQARQIAGSRCIDNSKSWLSYLLGGILGAAVTCVAWAAVILF